MFKKFFAFIKRLFRNLKGLAQKFVEPSIQVVENIKNLVESPLTTVVVNVIPGNLDDIIVQKLRKHLPRVLQILRISDECLQLQALDEIVSCVVGKLKQMDPDGRSAMYHSIASLLAHYASDGKLTWSEAVHLAEMPFTLKEQEQKNINNGN